MSPDQMINYNVAPSYNAANWYGSWLKTAVKAHTEKQPRLWLDCLEHFAINCGVHLQLLFFTLVLRGLSTSIHFSNDFLLLIDYSFCYFLIKQSFMIKENQALEVFVTSQRTLLFPDPFMRKSPAGLTPVSLLGAQWRNSGNLGAFLPP